MHTLEDAINSFVQPEQLEGYLDKGEAVAASKQALLLELPAVLVLSLKRFTYDGHGPHKIPKASAPPR